LNIAREKAKLAAIDIGDELLAAKRACGLGTPKATLSNGRFSQEGLMRLLSVNPT
jgi:hypothetical protein